MQKNDDFFEGLCASFYELILRYLYRALGDEGAARDTAQEVFLTACKKRMQLAQHSNPGGWLFQTAKILAKKARREAFTRAAIEPLPEEWESNTADESSLVEVVLDREIDEDVYINQVLDCLTPDKRMLYALYYQRGQSMKEIAGELRLEEAALRMRYVRLRREIQQLASTVAEKNFSV